MMIAAVDTPAEIAKAAMLLYPHYLPYQAQQARYVGLKARIRDCGVNGGARCDEPDIDARRGPGFRRRNSVRFHHDLIDGALDRDEVGLDRVARSQVDDRRLRYAERGQDVRSRVSRSRGELGVFENCDLRRIGGRRCWRCDWR